MNSQKGFLTANWERWDKSATLSATPWIQSRRLAVQLWKCMLLTLGYRPVTLVPKAAGLRAALVELCS